MYITVVSKQRFYVLGMYDVFLNICKRFSTKVNEEIYLSTSIYALTVSRVGKKSKESFVYILI